jgi:hypothetical protein
MSLGLERMTHREKVLAGIVALTLFVIVNLFLVRYFFTQQALLRAQLATKNAQRNAMEMLYAESDMWLSRDGWLKQHQPNFTNEGEAGLQMLDWIKSKAKAAEVTVENPAIGSPQRTDHYQGVPVTVEAKGSWAAMIKFLASLQSPGDFVVIESANMQIDSGDASMMRGKFRASKWYNPQIAGR